MSAELQTAVQGSELRSVNFFNGRLLTGDDLSREQDAQRATRLALGRAIGTGVACGLEVSVADNSRPAAPTVLVEAGLATNHLGQTLSLPCRTEVSLGTPPASGGTGGGLRFTDCDPPSSSLAAVGEGVFVLVVSPVRTSEGLAKASGLAADDATCAAALSVESVQFRLLRLGFDQATLSSDALARSRVAANLLGFGGAQRLRAPAAPDEALGPTKLDDQGHLEAADVPLAALLWKAGSGVQWVDLWSVRRGMSARATTARTPWLFDPAARARSEAIALQFAEQLKELIAASALPASLVATQNFAWLPSAALLPDGSSGGTGIAPGTFLSGLKIRQGRGADGVMAEPLHVEGARLRALLEDGLLHPPTTITTVDGSAAHEAVWLYRVRDNRDPKAPGFDSAQRYVAIAGGHVHYAAQPQFDLSHFDYANYAIRVP